MPSIVLYILQYLLLKHSTLSCFTCVIQPVTITFVFDEQSKVFVFKVPSHATTTSTAPFTHAITVRSKQVNRLIQTLSITLWYMAFDIPGVDLGLGVGLRLDLEKEKLRTQNSPRF